MFRWIVDLILYPIIQTEESFKEQAAREERLANVARWRPAVSRYEANDEAWDRLEQRCAEAERKLADARREAFEEAAQIMDEEAVKHRNNDDPQRMDAARWGARRIRARMEEK